jgi:uncharacterized protein involved in cysteine biosynthesis
MVRAFLLSLGQLGDPAVLKVLAKSLALTLVLFLLLGLGLWWGVTALVGWAGWGAGAGFAAATGAVLVAIVGGWLLFRVVAVVVIGLFADEVVAAVERRHYPEALASARSVPTGLALRMGLASAGRALLFNLLALPLYLLLLVTGIGTVLLFAAVNALLLGRDLGEMVAARHLDRAALRDWLGATRGQRFALGLAATGLFVVPVIGLVAPILGAAMATHQFHGRRT